MDQSSSLRGFGVPIAVWVIAMTLVVVVLWAVLSRPRPASGSVHTARGSVRAIVERGAATMPGPGTGRYRAPTTTERARLADLVTALADGDLDAAAKIAAPLGKEIEDLTDIETGRRFIVVRSADAAAPPAWGTLVFAPDAASDAVIEVPHPRSDLFTEHLGVELFLRSGARWLVVAGANRDATRDADVAHESTSAFNAMHERIVLDGDPGPVIQLHGFDGGARDYGDAVVSSGTDDPSELVLGIAREMESLGFSTCVHDATHCTGLGGTTNVQGGATRDAGRSFVHVELAQPLRADPGLRVSIADAITNAIRTPAED